MRVRVGVLLWLGTNWEILKEDCLIFTYILQYICIYIIYEGIFKSMIEKP